MKNVVKILTALATIAGAVYIIATPEAEAAEEAAAEEVPVAEAEEEAPEVVVAEHEPVAAEEDFAE